MSRTQDMTAAFVLGAMAGGVAALLWAPEKGEVTRKRLKDGTDELVKRGEALSGKVRSAAAEAIHAARQQVRQGELRSGNRNDALAGTRWLGDPRCQSAVVFCGDLNAIPGSPAYRRLTGVVRDAQSAITMPRVPNTWFSWYPVSRLDHIFLSPDITASEVTVSRTSLDQIASDHLPLLVQMRLPAGIG